MPAFEISDEHTDILSEMVNISMGRCASVLCDMTGVKIDLHVPHIQLVSYDEMTKKSSISEETSSVCMKFTNSSIAGQSAILFPEKSARKLVHILLQDEDMEALEEEEYNTVLNETLSEVGNIVINSLIGTISNMLEEKFDYGLPSFSRAKVANLFKTDEQSAVLLADTQFLIGGKDIEGMILIILTCESANRLIDSLVLSMEA